LPVALGIVVLALVGAGVREWLGPGAAPSRVLNRAAAELERGRAAPARAQLERLTPEDLEDPRVAALAGRILSQSGELAGGAELLRRAAAAAPGSPRVRYEEAKAALAARDSEAARAALADVLAWKPHHAGAHYLSAALAAREGRVVEAVLAMALALVNRPDLADRWRHDASFDPIRNDPRFVWAMRELASPDAWIDEESGA
jgi:predicted Zn-dependent protease